MPLSHKFFSVSMSCTKDGETWCACHASASSVKHFCARSATRNDNFFLDAEERGMELPRVRKVGALA
jgi:hypothetical protein